MLLTSQKLGKCIGQTTLTRRATRCWFWLLEDRYFFPGSLLPALSEVVVALQNTSGHDGQIRHLVYCLENAIISLPECQEQMVWIVDFRGYTMMNAPPFRTSLETLNILQNHYPERLAVALPFNAPQLFETFWKVGGVTFKLFFQIYWVWFHFG